MIRISTRGRYALRAMLDVAQHSGDGPVPRQDIATRQEISADYVPQLFRQLQAAGLAKGAANRLLADDLATLGRVDWDSTG